MKTEHDEYIRGRFAGVKIDSDPFPHFHLAGVLPPTVYVAMEHSLPPIWRWHAASLGDTFAGARWRTIRDMLIGRRISQPHFGARIPDVSASAGLAGYRTRWQERFSGYVELIDRLVIAAFKPHIEQYARRVHVTPSAHLGQSLFCHRFEDWNIEPHTHTLDQLIQSMIYFPLAGSTPEQGTILYRIKQPFVADAREFAQTRVFAAETVQQHSIMRYEPNALASFLNTPESVHSTNPIGGPSRRYIFSCTTMALPSLTGTIQVGMRTLEQGTVADAKT